MNNIALHGFGRIGRSILRAALRDRLFVPVSISDIRDLPTFAALFAVDSNYGLWPEPVRADGDDLVIGDRRIRYINSMEKLPDWQARGVDLVVDCTGRATVRSGAQAHLDRGAEHVLVSAPSRSLDDCDAVLLRGINLDSNLRMAESIRLRRSRSSPTICTLESRSCHRTVEAHSQSGD